MREGKNNFRRFVAARENPGEEIVSHRGSLISTDKINYDLMGDRPQFLSYLATADVFKDEIILLLMFKFLKNFSHSNQSFF